MIREHFNQLCKMAEEQKPMVMAKLASIPGEGVDPKAPTPAANNHTDYMQLGKDYAPAIGYGAGAGALAGIPISLLAHAMFGKERGIRGYLRSALMGSILGGGIGALGGGAGRYLYQNNPGARETMNKGINAISDFSGRHFGEMGKDIGAKFEDKTKNILGGAHP